MNNINVQEIFLYLTHEDKIQWLFQNETHGQLKIFDQADCFLNTWL